MNIGKEWIWASHQPLIKVVLELYDPRFILELGIGENSTPLFYGRGYLGIENDEKWIKEIHKKYYMQIIHHDLNKQTISLEQYYEEIIIPNESPRLLFVDNYESCRMIAINILRDKFDLIIFHDCEPEPGARINRYNMINSEGFNVYFLKTSANWTGLMLKINSGLDIGFNNLLKAVNPYIEEFKKDHPEVKTMYLDNHYEGFVG